MKKEGLRPWLGAIIYPISISPPSPATTYFTDLTRSLSNSMDNAINAPSLFMFIDRYSFLSLSTLYYESPLILLSLPPLSSPSGVLNLHSFIDLF